jgi:hypothetical protein
MKHIIVAAIGGFLFAFSLTGNVFAQQDVNFYCKNDCLAKSGTLGECNALCSTTDGSGAKTKDTGCLSACMAKGNQTAYSCYSACKISGDANGGQKTPTLQQDKTTDTKTITE